MDSSEGNVDGPEKPKSGSLNKSLTIIFVILGIIILGLIVGIIFVFVNKSSNDNANVRCEEIADEHEMQTCLSHEQPGEELDSRYNAVLQKAYDDGNYDLFDDVVLDRVSNLVLEDECEKSLNWLDSLEKKYADKLPILNRYGFYVSGIETAKECGNAEKSAYYQGKADAILNSEEYAAAVEGDRWQEMEDAKDDGDGDEYEE